MKLIILFAMLLTLIAAFDSSTVYASGMQDDVDQAVSIIQRFESIPEHSIPPAVLRDAKGLAILTVFKAGFVFSGRGGTGVVVAKTAKGWSGPSAIGTGGVGFGLQIGGEVTEFVLVLNTYDAVQAFSREGNFELGADLSVAAGPIGRSAEAGVTPIAAVYTYSISQGLFAGASLEGTVIVTRSDANAKYYGRPVTPQQILAGNVRPPAGAMKLENVLVAAASGKCGGMIACR
jgi:lipid-binding SYLF domain-containing protein